MAGNPIVEAIGELLAVLDQLGIAYYAGGSVASSVHGVPRYTQDVDLVADIRSEQTALLAARLQAAFYADAQQMRDAMRYGRSFNLIHLASGFKIDIFPLQKDEFHAGEMARSETRLWEVSATDSVRIQVASAEDTVLEKLRWYKRGGGISDRQWGDVLGVATTRKLNWDYMREWALTLGVADLLERLAVEAGQIAEE